MRPLFALRASPRRALGPSSIRRRIRGRTRRETRRRRISVRGEDEQSRDWTPLNRKNNERNEGYPTSLVRHTHWAASLAPGQLLTSSAASSHESLSSDMAEGRKEGRECGRRKKERRKSRKQTFLGSFFSFRFFAFGTARCLSLGGGGGLSLAAGRRGRRPVLSYGGRKKRRARGEEAQGKGDGRARASKQEQASERAEGRTKEILSLNFIFFRL